MHIRHERRGLFMPGRDDLYSRIQQGIGEFKLSFSPGTPNEAHALMFQTSHQQARVSITLLLLYLGSSKLAHFHRMTLAGLQEDFEWHFFAMVGVNQLHI